MMLLKAGARFVVQPLGPSAFAEQRNAVDAFGPEPVRVSDARVGLGATDCCRSAVKLLVGACVEVEGSVELVGRRALSPAGPVMLLALDNKPPQGWSACGLRGL
jgi:hypothetical protein